jgi:hypothetical protein
MEIDLGAERLLAVEREGEKIAVEVKSLLTSASAISEFHTAHCGSLSIVGVHAVKSPIESSI